MMLPGANLMVKRKIGNMGRKAEGESIGRKGVCADLICSFVHTGTEYGRCRFCERWFELSAEDRRSHKTICSGTCRTRLYRNRKRLAYEMSQEGKTDREVARELESDVKTVRGWIQRKEK
jgi:hypothetical protein